MTQKQLLEILARQAHRMKRGGSYFNGAGYSRSAYRCYFGPASPTNRYADLGSRVILIRRGYHDAKTTS